ncbi:hypothetical protein A2763_01310 [Candidatus Kaiserbacteria bacterium RIFCSPHIGHO2_01_FULL_54_36]|uniref:AATF leucine zipper-containing domain-containing protein n=1 Tax=Candidatus Kaiserbacteria bacterium RIFCSPHIGHO2_01_FULL_54_36 TaxID=1798482 RepID=A0A1F6CMN3_9BACT|nr:MAG: hypothetical protein A2763_01310 [Candidatus Kaiserbacteria bacterium RIFCSPHIGHO2_01_FULL_54_36]OGG75789.1 MAG: hypothetical protein A3A41_00080 [Candidatus Kaiserbacteria bacterium RIFCSPLOWO2_01_FULL_54_22]
MDPRERIRKTSFAITRAVGSPTSIVIHTLLFGACFYAAYSGHIKWELMLLTLTTIVSLEAIYLSLFIQMTLNFTTEDIEEVSEDIEEMQENLGEIQEDVGELQEDVEEISEEDSAEEQEEEKQKDEQRKTLTDIQSDLRKLMSDIEKLQSNVPPSSTKPLL